MPSYILGVKNERIICERGNVSLMRKLWDCGNNHSPLYLRSQT
ncbi:MAG: hypothetical protein ACJ70M_00555 [Nitrososphaera sp.]